MSLSLMLAAGAAVLILAALLVLQRRRAASSDDDTDSDAGDDDHRPDAAADDDDVSRFGLDPDRWGIPGTAARLKAVVRGNRTGLELLRDRSTLVFRSREDGAICVVHAHDGVYGGRPNWEHIAALTRAMGKAERCWPGADLSGLLGYVDAVVPVEYSPRLVADLEDETAPDPHGAGTV